MKNKNLNKQQNEMPEVTKDEFITLPNNEKIKVGPKAIPFTPAKASGKEILNMLKKAAKEGIFPPVSDLTAV